MTPFKRKYTHAQWQAIFDARLNRQVSYKRIAELAASGELVPGQAFTISEAYLRERCKREEGKRAGKVESPLADKPHKDAVEILRRRMISVADLLSADYEEQARKKPGLADPVRGRQIMAMVREARAMPEAKAGETPKPGQTVDGERQGERIRSGPGGTLLEAARRTQPQHQAEAEGAAGHGHTGEGGGSGAHTHALSAP